MATRVFCVDDNRLLIDALRRRLNAEPDLAWAGDADESRDVVAAVRDAAPDVLLLDIDLPGHDAFELARRLLAVAPAVRILMFSGHLRRRYLDLAMDAGTWGYISKNESIQEIIGSIRRAARGEFVLTPDINAMCLND